MVLYPNKLPESERVCSGICTQHQKMKGVRHSMRTKNMKITEMTWRTGCLFLKVLFVVS
jgi:hypothetical protein